MPNSWTLSVKPRIYDFFRILPMSIPSWSALQTLGQSKLLSLTVAAPFVGSRIIFNQHAIGILQLPPEVIERLLGRHVDIQAISFGRLYTVYYGLVFVGAASGLFKLLCPSGVRSYTNISGYIEGERPLITDARCKLLVHEVIETFVQNHEGEFLDDQTAIQRAAYPDDLRYLFHNVVEEITLRVETDAEELSAHEDAPHDSGSESANEQYDPDPFGIHYGMQSNIDTGKVAQLISMRRSAERAFWAPFVAISKEFLTDLLAMRYMGFNHSRPVYRFIVSILYGLGFASLLIPTVQTFMLISLGVTLW